MKAITISEFGGPEVLVPAQIEKPSPTNEQVLIRVKAFGVNRAETYMRSGAWGDVARVSGIECVGQVEFDPSNRLKPGDKVAAMMGGMGRTINGSYAEYVAVPASNVVAIETELPWAQVAAIPESYGTAWYCLFRNLLLKPGDTLFVRGGTSALGLAAINLAKRVGNVRILASTRSGFKAQLLRDHGASDVLIDSGDLAEDLRSNETSGVDAVLDLVGNTTLLDSLRMAKVGGTVCNAGFLGGGDPIAFNPLTDMPSGVNLNFFASFMLGSPDFPMSDIPLQDIIRQAEKGHILAKPSQVLGFDEVHEAHRVMESNNANGKLVVEL
ncbi:zinc-binding dehydrogenase [Ruegeria sp. MALMAid1280]|uniref:zinc-binding dehydrogenase n=1 Tax=Ruegeria sp. MALMAid1280 TaxID=3411634 RepID=UPI003BA13F38